MFWRCLTISKQELQINEQIRDSELRVIDDILESGVEVIAGENGLTRREREILGYLARGRSARYIAEDLVISENTVWAHVKRIYAKLDVHNRQELLDRLGPYRF